MNRSATLAAALALLMVGAGSGLHLALAEEGAAHPVAAEPAKPAPPSAEACKETHPPAQDVMASDRSMADAQAALSLDLLRAIAASSDAGTISVSPLGIAAVFSGLALGADETMRAAIIKTLRIPAAGKGEAGLEKLRAALRLLDVGRGDTPIQGADALFVDRATVLKPRIAKLLKAEARIPVKPVALDTQEGVDAVNSFVSQATKGLIPTILDAPPQGAALVAVNAFRFKDCWSTAFDPAETSNRPFHKSDGAQVDVATMRLDEKPLSYAVKGRFAAVDLGYRSADFGMILVTTIDKAARVDAFAPAAKLLAGEGFRTGPVDLALPSFGAESGRDLLPILAGLGLKAGLDSPKALSGFADGIGLGAVQQKTLVAVDEKGTVVAAATAAVATRSAAGPRAERITFDKPFVFALRHRPTGLVLMAGYVGEPKPASEAASR